MTDTDRILAEAAHWHVASARDDMDWDAFTSWLEADPRHRTAYEEIALADGLLDDLHQTLALDAAPDLPAPPAPVRRRWVVGGFLGAAAAAALALVVTPALRPRTDTVYATGATMRSIRLADGSRIELAPRSRLVETGGDDTHLVLTGGAWFDIRHDPARRMEIVAGPGTIGDIGTRFDVQASPDALRVAVSEGRVRITSRRLGTPVLLHAGQALGFDAVAGVARVGDAAPGEIGAWREGRLSYQDVPLPLVAGDLARYAGISVRVASSLDDRRFSGTLVIGDGQAAVRDLSQLMGLALGRDARGYRLDPAPR